MSSKFSATTYLELRVNKAIVDEVIQHVRLGYNAIDP